MNIIQLLKHWGLRGSGTNKAVFFCAVLLFIYSFAIYSKSLQNGFVWDSVGVILEDPMVRSIRNIPGFFIKPLTLGKTGNLGEGLTVNAIKYYRPLLSTLHTIEYALFGESPTGYKALNLIFNGLVVVLGFLVIRKLSLSIALAFLASLIYASTLARAEAVYWVYSDSHILSALFSLSAFLAYFNGRKWIALSLMVIGLLFQEGGVLFPMLLIAHEGTHNTTEPLLDRIRRVAPFGLISVLYLAARHFVVGELPSSSLSFWSLLKATGYQSWEHARIFLFPDGPATVYLYQEGMFASSGSASTSGVLAFLFFLVIALALWRFRKDDFFWYWWFLAWIVVSFNVGIYGDYLMAEKTLYLASLGLSVLVARLLLFTKRYQLVGLTIISSVFLFNSIQLYARADSWIDTTTYLEKVLQFEPEFDLALLQVGNSAYAEGRYEAAGRYYLRLLKLRPELVQSIGKNYEESILRQAEELTIGGGIARAILVLEEAVTIMDDSSELYNGLGNVHYISGNRLKAGEYWMFALQLDPGNSIARQNLKMLGTKNLVDGFH